MSTGAEAEVRTYRVGGCGDRGTLECMRGPNGVVCQSPVREGDSSWWSEPVPP